MADSTWVNAALDLNLKLNPLEMPRIDEVSAMRGCAEEDHFVDFQRKASVKKEIGVLVEELGRISSENKKLTEMLTLSCENYNNLQKEFMDLKRRNPEIGVPGTATSRKRKAESDDHQNNSTSCSDETASFRKQNDNNTKTRVSRAYVRITSSDTTLIVKDGYQWRKYGQKVTKDNPSPRAYFRCSFAPSCPVKKKVQRSVEDRNVLVATYEGEHNHPLPSNSEIGLSPTHVSSAAVVVNSNGQAVTLDMMQQPRGLILADDGKRKSVNYDDGIQNILIQQMAASLTRDPNFKAAIAAAVSGRFIDQTKIGQW